MTLTLRGLVRCGLWLGLYVVLVLFPLAWLGRAGGGFAEQLGAELVCLAVSVLAMQFLLTARFELLTPPFGADLVLGFHRGMGVVALVFAAAGAVLAHGPRGAAGELLGWRGEGGSGLSGALLLWSVAALVVTSAGRRVLRIPYVPWRGLHELLATAAVVLGLFQITSSGLAHDPVTRTAFWIWMLAPVALLAWARLVRPFRLLGRPYRLTGVRPEHGGAVTLVLDPDNHHGFRFRAGQFCWLTLGGSPLAARERPFCFSGSAQRAPRLEITVRAVGPFTRAVQEVKPGAVAYVDGPLGATSLDAFPDADRYFFVAAGIGIAPCMSMLRTLADRGDRRPHTLVYGSASWDEAAFREELAELASRLDLRVVHVLEKPPRGWLGETGLIGPELLERHLPRSGRRICFLAGPPAAMDVAEAALAALGIPLEDIHAERFEWE